MNREEVDNTLAKAKTPQPMPQRARKGGYRSDQNMDFNKSQSIEELTGGRIKKKSR